MKIVLIYCDGSTVAGHSSMEDWSGDCPASSKIVFYSSIEGRQNSKEKFGLLLGGPLWQVSQGAGEKIMLCDTLVLYLNDIMVRFHLAAALDLRLGVRIWKSECSSGF